MKRMAGRRGEYTPTPSLPLLGGRLGRERERGVGLINFLLICALIGFFALVGLRLFPLYMESFKVSTAMEAIASETGVGEKSNREIQNSMLRRFEVDDVDRFTDRNIRDYLTIKPNENGTGRILTMDYEAREPLLGNLDIVLKFNKSVTLPGAGYGE